MKQSIGKLLVRLLFVTLPLLFFVGTLLEYTHEKYGLSVHRNLDGPILLATLALIAWLTLRKPASAVLGHGAEHQTDPANDG